MIIKQIELYLGNCLLLTLAIVGVTRASHQRNTTYP